MTRSKLRWFWIFPVVAALCLIVATLYPSIVYYSETFCFVCMYSVVEAIVLVVVLSIFQKLDMFTSWKLIVFYAVVVAGSLVMSFLLEMYTMKSQQANFFPFDILVVFMVFVFLNFGLLAIIVDLRFWKACLMGTIMSLINTFLIMSTTTTYS